MDNTPELYHSVTTVQWCMLNGAREGGCVCRCFESLESIVQPGSECGDVCVCVREGEPPSKPALEFPRKGKGDISPANRILEGQSDEIFIEGGNLC